MARYVPHLRWKRGERNALADLTPDGKADVVPFFLLGADQFKPKKATKSKPAVPASVVIAQDVATAWGAGPFYFDASRIADVAGKPHRIESIAAECRNLGLQMMPAAGFGISASYSAAVQNIVTTDGRGVALRVDLQEMTSLSSSAASWPFPAQETDLIVDFGDQAATVAALGTALTTAFASLHNGSLWRSVTTVGTSMPENFTGLSQGAHTILRHEKAIWNQLAGSGLPYALDYGDYATVTTAAPPPGIAWGYPISVRYTLTDQFLICRGVRTKGIGSVDMDVQLSGHAKAIRSHPNRGALPNCWADQEIDAIATGRGPQGLEHWVRIGVNRHIEKARSDLP